jgi:hypothetical protein
MSAVTFVQAVTEHLLDPSKYPWQRDERGLFVPYDRLEIVISPQGKPTVRLMCKSGDVSEMTVMKLHEIGVVPEGTEYMITIDVEGKLRVTAT